ncbi:putative ribonuclease H-like domain-containing protein [Tanacetum coccineum]
MADPAHKNRFLEDKPIIAGDGPKWLFDIDVLTKSMNYVPVVAGTNSNDFIDGSLFDSSSKDASNDEPQPSNDAEKKDDEGGIDDQERTENSAQDVNTARPSINTASTNFNTGSLNINTVSPTVPMALHESTYADCFGDESELDLSNIATTYPVLSTPNTRIHKDHSLDHVIGDMQSGVQTRRMINEEGFISVVYEGKTHEDLHTFYKVEKALYGLHQALKAWYETLSTYLLDNGFQRGQIDKTLFIKRIKSDILLVQVYVDDIIFGSTKKQLCTNFEKLMQNKFQMSSVGELTFLLGLQVTQKDDGIFISQDKYMDEILKKFGFSTIKTANSRPNIIFAVYACARFQVTSKVSHLHAVKRIFRYLKGQPKLGLWYTKDSPFDLEAYTDSDYAGAIFATKSGQVLVNAAKQSSPRVASSISTARPINTAAPKLKVNDALPTTYSYFKAHLPVRRAFNQKSAAKTNNFNKKVNTARVNNVTTDGSKAIVSAAERNGENAIKSSACWIWRPTGNVIDHNSKGSGSYMLKRVIHNILYRIKGFLTVDALGI